MTFQKSSTDSLTTSKMKKFQTWKLSQFHKAKPCWTENWWSSGIMSNFWGEFFYVFGGGQKNVFNFFNKYCSVRTKKLHKISLVYIYFLNFYFGKINCVLLYYVGDTSTRNHRYKYHKRDVYETFIHIELKEYLAIIQLLKKKCCIKNELTPCERSLSSPFFRHHYCCFWVTF